MISFFLLLCLKGDPPLFAYWDNGDCGSYGDDHNWEWCDTNNGGPCKEQVNTSKCPSGIARLTSVQGDQFAKGATDNYQDPNIDCFYTYFATYTCTGNPLRYRNQYIKSISI